MSKINNIAIKDILGLQVLALCDDNKKRIFNFYQKNDRIFFEKKIIGNYKNIYLFERIYLLLFIETYIMLL